VKNPAPSRAALFFLLSPLVLLFASLLASTPVAAATASSPEPQVVVLHLEDTIQPISEEYILRGLKQAEALQAEAVLIELNTPGGLLDTTREMVRQILDSAVPVIVYVAPSGSRAGSAGFFLLEAADIAAMAPGTNAGASHPVVEGGGQLDPIMKQKLENDTTAFLRSFTTRRGRNPTAAEDAVLNSKSYTEQEALKLNLITLIAGSDRELLDSVDGKTITRFNGTSTTLHTRNARLTSIDPTTREQLLDKLTNPNLAVLFLIAGALLIYLEFNVPGTIIPGALGTLFVCISLFSLNLLPVRYTAIMLIVGAVALLVLEAKFASHGVLATAGILCLVFGLLTLVDGPIPELRVHASTAIAAGAAFGVITVFLVRMAIRARRNKSVMGVDALIGLTAVAQQPLSPTGQVLVHGELWQAESPLPVAPGEQVRVKAVRNLTLLVDRIPANSSSANS
jgi:membrane-bound serine protease (ClpP class)